MRIAEISWSSAAMSVSAAAESTRFSNSAAASCAARAASRV